MCTNCHHHDEQEQDHGHTCVCGRHEESTEHHVCVCGRYEAENDQPKDV